MKAFVFRHSALREFCNQSQIKPVFAFHISILCCRYFIKELVLLAVRISSYGCTWEVWKALKKLELLSVTPQATPTLLSCSPNFPPRASITRYRHAKQEPILKSSRAGNLKEVDVE